MEIDLFQVGTGQFNKLKIPSVCIGFDFAAIASLIKYYFGTNNLGWSELTSGDYR